MIDLPCGSHERLSLRLRLGRCRRGQALLLTLNPDKNKENNCYVGKFD